MKIKDLLMVILLLSSLFFLSSKVYAEDIYDFGGSEIYGALPDEASEKLDELNVSAENGGIELTPKKVFENIWGLICENISSPLSILVSVIAVIVLCTVIESLNESGSKLSEAFNSAGILACSGIICTGFGSVISAAKTAAQGLYSFLSVYIPAFGGIMAANGQTASATAYCGIITVAVELFSQTFTLIVIPLTSCIMGISVAGAVNPDLKINSFASMAQKAVNWILAFVMTVFAGLLSVQGFVGAAADSASMKAVKFTVSGTVPIVGGAVSDALLAVKGSIGVIKASTGSFGIIASAAVILPALISLGLYRLILILLSAVSDCFGTSQLTPLLKSAESVVSILIAVIVCFWTVAVASTALMLAIGGGEA
ncbi:MAG: stage III sporulation protein AE [Firmicutes bacterium]|nr:stage III sporulation protein AE [[Eubacterium] siraeum]MCM1487391.1 stage III sporulation protein AE [Bacillota bacterium]